MSKKSLKIPKKFLKSKEPRKYSWPKARNLLYEIVKKYIPRFFIDKDKYEKQNIIVDCISTLEETDQFHPWDTDGDFQNALDGDTNSWGQIDDSLVQCFDEIFNRISEWYNDPNNFAPGYDKPKMLENCYGNWFESLSVKDTEIKKFIKEVYKKSK